MIPRHRLVGSALRCLVAVTLVTAACAFPARSTVAHDFHASLTQIEVNASTKTVEVAIRVFVDDLEDALSRSAGRRVQFGTTDNFDALALAYVNESLRIESVCGERLTFSWVGKEAKVNVAWLYVEAPLTGPLEGGHVQNGVFFELFEDQVNTVNLKDGKRRATLTFSTGEGPKPVALSTEP